MAATTNKERRWELHAIAYEEQQKAEEREAERQRRRMLEPFLDNRLMTSDNPPRRDLWIERLRITIPLFTVTY